MLRLKGAILVDSFDEILDLEEKLKLDIDDRFIYNDSKSICYDKKSHAFIKKKPYIVGKQKS